MSFVDKYTKKDESGNNQSSDIKHVQYDAQSYYGIRKANQNAFGNDFIPNYHFDKAKTIVSIGADFLSSWLCQQSLP